MDYIIVLCSLLTPLTPTTVGFPTDYTVSRKCQRPPGVSDISFHLSCLIYSFLFRMTIGLLDLKLNYPEKQAYYQVSVRHDRCLPPASFGFPVTRDTLAFSYKIPAITALSGLGGFPPHPLDVSHARHTWYSTLSGLASTINFNFILVFRICRNIDKIIKSGNGSSHTSVL